jgi:uncharacterized protein
VSPRDVPRELRYTSRVLNGLVPLAARTPAHSGATSETKQQRLLDSLSLLDSVLIALSGGADSAYLTWAAHRALGERALAITALSASYSSHDRAQAEAFVRYAGVRHEFIETHEFENPLYVSNNADRCYHCKAELFTELDRIAIALGFAAVAYGVNADDTGDFRPGHRAAAEHRVLAPLLDVGMRKDEVRELSRRAGLPTWDRPASACLSSRIPYGTQVTPTALAMVERGEAVLRELGFRQFRVRYYEDLARVEIAQEELARALESSVARQMHDGLRAAGFARIELDPDGYRQGSLNAALKTK